MANIFHSRCKSNLLYALVGACKDLYAVFADLSLCLPQNGEVITPDACLYALQTFTSDAEKVYLPPVCVVEILAQPCEAGKVQSYFQFGVQKVWIALPASQTVYVYSSAADYQIYTITQTIQDEILGITLPVGLIFESWVAT